MAHMMGMLKQGRKTLSRCLHSCRKSFGEGLFHKPTSESSFQTGISGWKQCNGWINNGNLNGQASGLGFAFRVSGLAGRSIQLGSGLHRLGYVHPPMARSYYVDRHGVTHFKMRGPRRWVQGPEGGQVSQRLMIVLVLLGGSIGVVYFTHIQTVPYTNRKHVVLISPKTERKLGEISYRELCREFKGRILPQYHPEVVRVSRIAQRIIESAMTGIHAEDLGQLEIGGRHISDPTLWDSTDDQSSQKKNVLIGEVSHKDLYTEDDTLEEGWVESCRQEGLKQGRKGYTEHLQGMKWEVLVVDAPAVNAVCMPGGKIMVFTGLLKHFRTDEEIATVLSHEVGHALARHSAESLTRSIFLGFFEILILIVVNAPGAVNTASNILLRLPFSRRMETEADHIGLLIMASAGYDPRVAPSVYEKLGQLDKVPEYAQYISTHPSGKRRAELLKKSSTMNEALNMYQEKVVGRQAQGYLFL